MKVSLIFLILLASLQMVEAREWKNREGNSFEGELVGANNTQATIIRETDRRHFTLDRSVLSDSDNQFIDQHLSSIQVKELRGAIPDTYRKALRKTKDSKRKTIILYAPDFDRKKLELIIEQILSNKQLMESIGKQANLAILTDRDRKMEVDLPFGVIENAINVFLYTDLFEHIHFSWGEELDSYSFDIAFEEVLNHKR